MLTEQKQYSEYIDTGLPWIGKMPSHWKLVRTKYLFSERVQKGFPNEPLLAATQNMGVVTKEAYGERTVTALKDLHLLKLVEKGDFVISLRSFQGGIEQSYARGIISPAYTVLKPSKSIIGTYYKRFFKSKKFINSLSLFVTGIREGQNIDYERLKRAYMPLPPEEEQKNIGKYLDKIVTNIDMKISVKEKFIELLNEQKQAIIHRAVTRGLDPNVKLKDSGIPWIGKVPEHWEVRKLKNLGKSIIGLTFSPGDLTDSGCRVFRASNVRNGKILFNEDDYFLNQSIPKKLMILKNDILICSRSGSKELIGKNAIVEDIIEKCTFGVFMTVYRSECNKYVYWVLNSQIFSSNLGLFFTSTINQLTRHDLDNMYITLPPKNEQDIICEYLKNEIEEINNIIRLEDDNCKLINEYKIKLISEIVTGKINLKDIAKNTSNVKGAKNE